MTASLKNFVTINKNRGDLLTPESFQSINEMILGMYENNHYRSIKDEYSLFANHVLDFNDPHHTAEYFNSNDVVERVYTLYTNMTLTPLSFNDFYNYIYNTIGYLELVRRIVLNRFIYLKVKNTDGSVPTNVSVYLSRQYTSNPGIVSLTFPSGINNEIDFVRQSIGTNSLPIPVVRNADDLTPSLPNIPVLYTNSSSGGDYKTDPYDIVINTDPNLVVSCNVVGLPSGETTLFILARYMSPSNDLINVILTPAGKIKIIRNGVLINSSDINCSDGKLVMSLKTRGEINLITSNNGTLTLTTLYIYLEQTATINAFNVQAPLENIFNNGFGIRSITLYKGNVDSDSLKYFLM
jgi:hypothetical protein